MTQRFVLIQEGAKGLKYVDGAFISVLGPGRHTLERGSLWQRLLNKAPIVDVRTIDMRHQDMTIKGQEILTADKVALRVSILVQFCVVDPVAAMHAVSSYNDRLYSDVQLAARRSLAAMTLEDILTNRTRLSEDILREVQESAASYGVTIGRSDVKDLVFPGNLQEIMNKVLAAERTSQAQLVEARTRSEVQKLDAATRGEVERLEAVRQAEATRIRAEAEAEAIKLRAQAERQALEERSQSASIYANHPALLRLEELKTLQELAKNAEARLYIDFPDSKQPDSRAMSKTSPD